MLNVQQTVYKQKTHNRVQRLSNIGSVAEFDLSTSEQGYAFGPKRQQCFLTLRIDLDV